MIYKNTHKLPSEFYKKIILYNIFKQLIFKINQLY